MTITEADILRTVKQKLAEFEAARDQTSNDDAEDNVATAEKPVKVPELVDCAT
jgi:hypothetical protein